MVLLTDTKAEANCSRSHTVSVSGTREQSSELNRHSLLVTNKLNIKSVNLTQSLAPHESGTETQSMVENRTRDEYCTLRVYTVSGKCARSVKSAFEPV